MYKNKIQQIMKILLSLQLYNMIFYYIISKFYKSSPKYKDLWLISERGTEAKDNGYVFFKYLRENHPQINACYLIDKKYTKDYEKVKKLGNVIQYGSHEHKVAFTLCKYAISTHFGYVECWSYRLYKKVLDRKSNKKYIFLQHGVTKDDISKYLSKEITNIDLFITSTNDEFDSIVENKSYGYKQDEVVRTGLARFDLLNNNNVKNQILLMPTWRMEFSEASNNKGEGDKYFLESDYYRKYYSLISNKRVDSLLEENNIKLIVYPHYEMQKYLKYFDVNSSNIIIASKDVYDVQALLKESKLLITDYSSVFFDFAYMKKPTVYYQFDSGNYQKGYFNYQKHGFGAIYDNEDDVVREIEYLVKNNFVIQDKFKIRIEECFGNIDQSNCERIYNEILTRWEINSNLKSSSSICIEGNSISK